MGSGGHGPAHGCKAMRVSYRSLANRGVREVWDSGLNAAPAGAGEADNCQPSRHRPACQLHGQEFSGGEIGGEGQLRSLQEPSVTSARPQIGPQRSAPARERGAQTRDQRNRPNSPLTRHARQICAMLYGIATGRKPAFPPAGVPQFHRSAIILIGHRLPGQEVAQVGAFGTVSPRIKPLKRSLLGLAGLWSLASGANNG